MCRASNTIDNLLWTRRDGQWRDTILTHEAYMADLVHRGQDVPHLFATKGLRLECIMVDTMHAVDMGICAHIIGNIVFLVMMTWPGVRTLDQGAAEANKRLKEWYRVNRHPHARVQGAVTLSRIRTKKDWPKIKARSAATRHMCEWALEIATARWGAEPSKELMVIKLMTTFYRILSAEGRWLSTSAIHDITRLCRTMFGLYMDLSQEALARRKRLWKMTPKWHLLLHLSSPEHLELGNPMHMWCYADEDLQKSMRQIGTSCAIQTVEDVLLLKWVFLRFV